MVSLRNRINEKKINYKKVYGVKSTIDLKRLYKKMDREKSSGKNPEIFKKLDEFQKKNNLDNHNIKDLKIFAKEYLRLNGIIFEEEK